MLDKCPLNRAQTGNERTHQEWLAVSIGGLPHRVVTGRVELAQLLARYTPSCFKGIGLIAGILWTRWQMAM